jgi:predicted kinase
VNYPDPRGHDHGAPVAVIVGGYAGSGKTETGRILARMTGWPMLDKDSTTRPVVEAALTRLGLSPHDRESETYLKHVRPAEYEALRMCTMENISCGNSVIVTAPHTLELRDPAWCERMAADLEALGAGMHAVWVRADPDSMRTYILRRDAARDAYKLANWTTYVEGLDLEYTPAAPHTIINNSLASTPLQSQVEQLLSRLGAPARR